MHSFRSLVCFLIRILSLCFFAAFCSFVEKPGATPGTPAPEEVTLAQGPGRRSPSPRAWRPDFPGAAREAPCLQLPGIQAPQVGQQLVTGTIMPRNAGRGSHRPGSEVSSRNRNSSCGNSGSQAPRLSPPSRSRIQPRAAFSAQHACLVFLCLLTSLFHKEGFPGGSAVKNPPPSAGDPGSIPESGGRGRGWEDLGERH